MDLAFITHPDCLMHDINGINPEQPARLKVIEETIKRAGLYEKLKHYTAPLVTREQLLRAHDKEYIDFIFNSSPQEGIVFLDPDTGMNPYTLTAALRAAGSVILGVDLILKKEVQKVFCSVRPPGHHAEKAKAMGFCIFNNVAIGAMHALDHYRLKRIAIIDFDVHHGNGTENIFYNDKRVLFCSSFQSPLYPFSGEQSNQAHIINIPLAANTTGVIFREEVASIWKEKIREFKPEILFVSAGFDGYKNDPIAQWLLREEDYAWLGEELSNIANQYCKGRIVSVLEGGYDLDGLGKCVASYIQGCLINGE